MFVIHGVWDHLIQAQCLWVASLAILLKREIKCQKALKKLQTPYCSFE